MPPANARRLGFEARLKLVQGDWAEGLVEKFDLILCNPPYVADGAELGPGVREYEPDEALFAGDEGLDAYRALAPQLPRLLDAGRACRGRNRLRPGRCGDRTCSPATGSMRGCRTTSPGGRAPCC